MHLSIHRSRGSCGCELRQYFAALMRIAAALADLAAEDAAAKRAAALTLRGQQPIQRRFCPERCMHLPPETMVDAGAEHVLVQRHACIRCLEVGKQTLYAGE